VLSPYLWSFTTAYTKCKFVADGSFSATAVSKQCGAVALLLQYAARKDIELLGGSAPQDPEPTHATSPPFPGVALRRGDRGSNVCNVQDRLRRLGFAIAQVAGARTGRKRRRP